KPDRPPTSGFHRYAMLSLATRTDDRLAVSTLELEKGEGRYTVDTLPELHSLHPKARVFFVMGADCWTDIKTWRDWENVLRSSDHVVVTRPGYEMSFDHVTDAVRERIVDLRGGKKFVTEEADSAKRIFITDAVHFD